MYHHHVCIIRKGYVLHVRTIWHEGQPITHTIGPHWSFGTCASLACSSSRLHLQGTFPCWQGHETVRHGSDGYIIYGTRKERCCLTGIQLRLLEFRWPSKTESPRDRNINQQPWPYHWWGNEIRCSRHPLPVLLPIRLMLLGASLKICVARSSIPPQSYSSSIKFYFTPRNTY